MGINPATAESKQNAEPLLWTQDLAFAVPSDAEDQDGLQVADDVERERARPSDDEELAEIVHASHDAGCANAPEDIGGDGGEVRDFVEEGDEGDQEADGDGGLVEEELGWGDAKVFDFLADPDLVEGGGAEGEGCDDDAERGGFDGFVHGEADADAGCDNGGQHVARDLLAEEDEVDEHDGGRGHDLGELVEADRVEGEREVAEHDVAGEEAADGEHVEPV